MREYTVYISGSIGKIDKNLYIVAQYLYNEIDSYDQYLDRVNTIFVKYGRMWRPAQKLAHFIKESGKKEVVWENVPEYPKKHIKRELREKYKLVLRNSIMKCV